MSLGKKIRYARKCCGLSQEQLAEKMCVSRSAIAKWETDKGLPDIENLKVLSRLLGISLDSLLDDRSGTQPILIQKRYQLCAYGRGCNKLRKDRLMRNEFPEARICTLLGRPLLTQEQNTPDTTLGFLTPVPFGTPEYVKSLKNLEKAFYLVEQEDLQLFVTVTEDTLQIHPLEQKQAGNSFQLGNWLFIRGNDLLPE